MAAAGQGTVLGSPKENLRCFCGDHLNQGNADSNFHPTEMLMIINAVDVMHFTYFTKEIVLVLLLATSVHKFIKWERPAM